MQKIVNPVTVKEFVNRLEKFNLDFYNNCLLKTNQFSTKYILQQAIKNQQDHQTELLPSIELLGTDEVDSRDLDDILANFTQDFVEGQFELESLNFVEATHLALILLEYIIDKYQKLMNCKLSPETRSSLEVIFQKKQELLSGLKSEYEKRRYK